MYEFLKSAILFPLSWGCSFTDSQQERVKNLFRDNADELWTWTLLTALLPLMTFSLASLINILFIDYECGTIYSQLGEILNNGSLPIIAFGVISSSVSYLVEKLSMEKPDEEDEIINIRKRIMAIGTLMLFLTSGIFLLQSIKIVTARFDSIHHLITFVISVVLTIYAVVIGRKMFVLQTNKVKPPADQAQSQRTQSHTSSLEDKYGN